MPGPELGFVEGGHPDTNTAVEKRPVLNAQQAHTHIVENGVNQVARGGIECALDGGKLDFAMYDVTDGVLGAPQVFTQTVTLPERPLADEDGYEFGAHTFELDPVGLAEYVGHELAVAVRHHDDREIGNNWNNEFPVDRGLGVAEMSKGDPLPDTWQTGLSNHGEPPSAALFVEPPDLPAGKARTVIGNEVFGTQSQTVFAAFPDLSPETGLVVEYDAQTAAGAPVLVLENGGIETGQGSATTDSFEVSVRDADGTWYGPETIVLAERSR